MPDKSVHSAPAAHVIEAFVVFTVLLNWPVPGRYCESKAAAALHGIMWYLNRPFLPWVHMGYFRSFIVASSLRRRKIEEISNALLKAWGKQGQSNL